MLIHKAPKFQDLAREALQTEAAKEGQAWLTPHIKALTLSLADLAHRTTLDKNFRPEESTRPRLRLLHSWRIVNRIATNHDTILETVSAEHPKTENRDHRIYQLAYSLANSPLTAESDRRRLIEQANQQQWLRDGMNLTTILLTNEEEAARIREFTDHLQLEPITHPQPHLELEAFEITIPRAQYQTGGGEVRIYSALPEPQGSNFINRYANVVSISTPTSNNPLWRNVNYIVSETE